MSDILTGKTIVITGASRGLGAGMAERFLERGAQLGVCARSTCSVGSHERVVAAQLDMSDSQAVAAFAQTVQEQLGDIDLWINNAGVLEPIRFVRDLSGEELEQHLRINVLGVLNGTQAFLHQRGGNGGVLINISSGAALKGYAGWGAYCAGKAAVDRLTECLQLEESASGLRAYSVAPGVIDTDMQKMIRACKPEDFPMREKFVQLKANDAFNTPAYVADCLAELAFGNQGPTSVVLRLPSQ